MIDRQFFAEMVAGCRGNAHDPILAHRMIENLQEMVGFQEGELICAWTGAFPSRPGKSSIWGTAPWKIIDAKQGVVGRGSLSPQMAKMVSKLPSACQHAEPLFNGNSVKSPCTNVAEDWVYFDKVFK